MLRSFVLCLGVALLMGAVASAALHFNELTVWLFLTGGLVTIGTMFERVIYKPTLTELPGGDWADTGERFIDPETGKTIAVFNNPALGERRYVVVQGGG